MPRQSCGQGPERSLYDGVCCRKVKREVMIVLALGLLLRLQIDNVILRPWGMGLNREIN